MQRTRYGTWSGEATLGCARIAAPRADGGTLLSRRAGFNIRIYAIGSVIRDGNRPSKETSLQAEAQSHAATTTPVRGTSGQASRATAPVPVRA